MTGAMPSAVAQEASETELAALVDEGPTPAGAVALAQRLALAGDLTGAAATLERALIANPNAHAARLAYIGLLCRLDDGQGARVEAARLNGQAISDAEWDATNTACGNVLTRPAAPAAGSTGGVSGQVWMGLAFDSNASGPLAVQFDILNVPLPSRDGLAMTAGARVSAKSESYDGSGGAYGSAAIVAKNSIDGPDQHYVLGEVRAGYGRKAADGGFAVGALFRHARIFGSPYVSELGTEAHVDIAADATSRLYVRGEASYQWYDALGPGGFGNGWRLDAGVGYEKKLGEDSWFAAGAAFEHKDAKLRDNGYVGGRIYAAYQRPIGAGGAYLNVGTTLRYIDFKDRAPALDRRDFRATARGAVGIPLADTGLTFELSGSYTARQVANRATVNPRPVGQLNVADYGNFGAEARLIFKF